MAQLSLFYLHIKTYGQNVTSYNFNFLAVQVYNLPTVPNNPYPFLHQTELKKAMYVHNRPV